MSGTTILTMQPEHQLRDLYKRLPPEHRTWRCEQAKKSQDLLEESWKLLEPCTKGVWERDEVYKGIALFLKSTYEGQGYATVPFGVVAELGPIMRTVQEHMPWVQHQGRRVQADDSPARYALRVAMNCVMLVYNSVMVMPGTTALPQETEELLSKAQLMAESALSKLGGPLKHEETMTAEERSMLAALATAQGPAVGRLLQQLPVHVITIYVLQAQYDIDLKVIKWVLCLMAARCAKEAYSRVLAARVDDWSVRKAAAKVTLEHTTALLALTPEAPIASFLHAEAKVAVMGTVPDALKSMRNAVQLAERCGDDVVAYLAHLNVALMLVHGAAGASFSEQEVRKAMEGAAAQRRLAHRWNGHMLTEARCAAIKKELNELLDRVRDAAGPDAGDLLPAQRRPWDKSPGPGLEPVPVEARQCAQCNGRFHKTLMCGGCRSVWYCCKDCQMRHWKAGHKAECKQLGAAKKGAEGEGAKAEGPAAAAAKGEAKGAEGAGKAVEREASGPGQQALG